MATFLGDITNNYVGGLTLAPAVITADVATDPSISVDMATGEGLVTMIAMLGVVHAATTGVITPVESTTGLTGTWTTIGSGNTISFDTTDATQYFKTFQRTKRYVGALVDVSGGTLSAGIAVLMLEQKKLC